MKEALVHAAWVTLPEAEDRIKGSPKYVSHISTMVRIFYMVIVFIIYIDY
jgi:hypothetical protein